MTESEDAVAICSMNEKPTPLLPPLVLHQLLQRAPLLWDEDGWEPFRPGIQIRRLYQENEGGPAAALLRYEPGASVPSHEHLGYEHILVLDGEQSDEHGTYPVGTFVVNRPHTAHRVASRTGCVVLVIWEKAVRFPGSGSC
jgi:anti-sigma factor ChrR (cupin superfamily)